MKGSVMSVWVVIAVLIFAVAVVGLGVRYARYRKGEITRPDFLAGIVLVLLVLILFLLLF
jgi:hypothetical protein